MNEKFQQVLERTISKNVYEEIIKNYNDIKKNSVFELGIDSFDYLSLIIEIESSLNITTEDYSGANSLEDFERLFENEHS